MSPAPTPPTSRTHVVDAVRGVAVLVMIGWHTAESWLGPEQRAGRAFGIAGIVGGLAAPLFMMLAGVAVGLTEPKVHSPETTRAALGRAAQIIVLGYGLKLFAFGVDQSGLLGPMAPWVVLDAVGLTLLYLGLSPTWPAHWGPPWRRAWLLILGAGCGALAIAHFTRDPHALELVLRLDILQGIGASLAVLALIMPASAARFRVGGLLVLGVAVALATPPLAALALQPSTFGRVLDYVARLAPYPAPTGARFPLFPWLAYPLVGAAVGRAIRGRAVVQPFALPRPLWAPAVMLLGATVLLVSFEAGPLPQFLLARGELVRNLVRLIFNVAVGVWLAGTIATFASRGPAPARALALIGRHSLLIYAAHLEIAYGLVSVPVQRALSYPSWAALSLVLIAAMLGLAGHLERRSKKDGAPQTASEAPMQA